MPPRGATAVLCGLFLLSGASALLFETLWLRLAGLAFGNGVWASSLVLSSFMAGLAVGNLAVSWLARRWPAAATLRGYALLEALIGITGMALVGVLPAMPEIFAPLLRPFLERPALLNPLRLLLAFALLSVPATAMGATLPVAVRALATRAPEFGRTLGLLYGANTAGAVVGALIGELLLIERLGLLGSGVVAAAMNAAAALGALALAYRLEQPEHAAGRPVEPPEPRQPHGRLLAAAFLCGAILLALEVVWFRFLRLFASPASTSFAWLLATVLLGISIGGWLGGVALHRRGDAARLVPAAACLAGAAVVCDYAAFATLLGGRLASQYADAWMLVSMSAVLMLPVCVLSGLLFTWLGALLRACGLDSLEAAARLTFANTCGGILGSALAGFVLLPWLGMERALVWLAAAYAVVAALAWPEPAGLEKLRPAKLLTATALAGCLVLFPSGLMRARFFGLAAARFTFDDTRVVAVREGLTETILYLRRELWGEQSYVRLVTNGFSMSSSQVLSRRYMKLFVYWPVALHPEPRRALLISYGVGATAQALADTRALESIDVVDISREILEESRKLSATGAHPLDDPRVRVHVEDGRFFLLTSARQFDLITGEPPPPKNAGIGSLYSREYFALLRRRLAPGGIVTYWLPVYQLSLLDSKAIVRGFCEAFPECSLWTGAGLEWMLVANQAGGRGPVSAAQFRRQWQDPQVAPELRRLGFELPEQIGASFLADAETLAAWTRGVLPLEDDHPQRLSPDAPRSLDPAYRELMDVIRARALFARSPLIARLWPAELRADSASFFEPQRVVNDYLLDVYAHGGMSRLPVRDLAAVLAGPMRRTLPLWLLNTDDDDLEIARRVLARGGREPVAGYVAGLGALAERDYSGAAARLEETLGKAELPWLPAQLVLAWCLGGQAEKARAALASQGQRPKSPAEAQTWVELQAVCTRSAVAGAP